MLLPVFWLWVNSHEWPGWDIDVLRAVSGSSPPEARPVRELLRPGVAVPPSLLLRADRVIQ